MEKKRVNKVNRFLKFLVLPVLLFTVVIGSLCSFTYGDGLITSYELTFHSYNNGNILRYMNGEYEYSLVSPDIPVLEIDRPYYVTLHTPERVLWSGFLTPSVGTIPYAFIRTATGNVLYNPQDSSAKYTSFVFVQDITSLSNDSFSSGDMLISVILDTTQSSFYSSNDYIFTTLMDNYDYLLSSQANITISIYEDEPNPVEVTDIWTSIMNWIVSSLSSVQAVFFSDGGLTFLGSLAIISVAIGLAFLLIAVISRFLSLRS